MSLFDPAAAVYAEVRPHYPEELYDALDRLAGPLAGARVLDLAAGTGIATAALARRGARVVAVEPGAAMLAQLRRGSPEVPAVRALAEALPVREACVDLVTVGTAWHWVDHEPAAAELHRVVRPGGSVAIWWGNGELSDAIAWERAQLEVFDELGLQRPPPSLQPERAARLAAADLEPAGFAAEEVTTFRWQRRVSVEEHLRLLSSHSVVIRLGEARGGELLARLRSALAGEGRLVERFVAPLLVARRHG